jgi:Holliday junction resolvase RusA-like endonuclease
LTVLWERNCIIDAICLQESWLAGNENLSDLNIDDYTLIDQGKTASLHGGLVIYLHKKYQYRILPCPHSQPLSSWEYQSIEVILDDTTRKSFHIGNLYRLPRETNDAYDLFLQELSIILQHYTNNRTNIVICGDFNIDLLKIHEKPKVNDFFDLMLSNGLLPKITLPTRFSTNSATLIDNVFCRISNDFSKSLSGVLTSQMSDHQPCFVSLDYLHHKPIPPKYVRTQCITDAKINESKLEFESLCITENFENGPDGSPNTNLEILCTAIQTLKDKHFPVKYSKFHKHKHKINRWITPGLLISIKFRDKLFIRFKKCQRNTQLYYTLQNNLKTYNSILKSSIRTAKIQYYHSTFNKYKRDIKNTWKTIKDIVNKTKNKNTLPNYFKIDGSIVTNPEEIAKKFNAHYNNIGPQLATKISHPANINFRDYLSHPVLANFEFAPIDSVTVEKAISHHAPKTSCGVDEMSFKFIKQIKDVLKSPLSHIINQTLHTGIFPARLKQAKIIPIYKKNDIYIMDNYRPISILPALSKVFEKIMLDQLTSHFKKLNLIFGNQYGFRKGHSTEHAVLENIDRIVENLENGHIPLNIFLDLSKAFDTLDHNILIEKLSYYGIRGIALDLCRDYLTNRTQQVLYNNTLSPPLTVKTGVPQGSILGPFLFLVYINDFARSTDMFSVIMYADDTTLYAKLSNRNNTDNCSTIMINTELVKINNWLKVNRLSLNKDKTTYMLFHNINKVIPDINLEIDSAPISRVDNFDFLGITIDKSLTWKSHISKITSKILKAIAIMTRIKHFLPCETLKTIYNCLINCHLQYGLLLWGEKGNPIFKLQKRAVRIVGKQKYNSHTEPLFKMLTLPKLQDIQKIQEWKFYYNLKNNNLPKYFHSILLIRHLDIHTHETRNNTMLVTPRLKFNSSRCSIRNRLPSLINSAPSSITEKIQTHSLNGFALYLKKLFIDQYTNICSIQNCYICGSN